jgi:hypothetical protein
MLLEFQEAMMSKIRYLGMIVLLCGSLSASAQERQNDPFHREQATQTGEKVERTIRTREPKWKLKESFDAGDGFHQDWKSGNQEIRVSIYVYDSPEEASNMLLKHARSSSVAGQEELSKFGDEAFVVSHHYFSWVLVRSGRTVAVVHGPPNLTVTKRFAQYALMQIEGK